MINNLIEEHVHKPVMVREICEAFNLIAPLNYQVSEREKPIIIDATIGGGGHAWEFIKRGAFVLGFDADEKMIKIAGDNLKKLACPTGNCDNFFKLVNENYISIDVIAKDNAIDRVDAILFDLGISSYHFQFNKGFSFQDQSAPLDMRLSDLSVVTAADLLNALSKDSLTEMFLQTMPYFKAVKLSRFVVDFRKNKEIRNVGDFLELIDKTFPKEGGYRNKKGISLPTLPFLALRIAVNTELDNLKISLDKSWNLLKKGGVLAVISFHSGEDAIVKNYFAKLNNTGVGKVNKKPLKPDESEIQDNHRSRSAKLRVITKV